MINYKSCLILVCMIMPVSVRTDLPEITSADLASNYNRNRELARRVMNSKAIDSETLSDTRFYYDEWKEAEAKAANAVAQIISIEAKFDWSIPYRAPEPMPGAGSGFFIDQQGHMLTNFHVVNQSTTSYAHIPALGKIRLPLEKVSACPEADVALMRLTPEALALVKQVLHHVPTLELGDSDALYPAESVLAHGYPLGEESLKRTTGVFAGRKYSERTGKSYMHITAPINPGNSGGPLLNRAGQVVGINTSGIREAQNIGYIIPINDVKILLDDFLTTHLLRKPDLGIMWNKSTDQQARYLSNPVPGGVYVNYVSEGSIAYRAGMQVGDMLYEINGYALDRYGDINVKLRSSDKISFEELLIRFKLNEEIKLVFYRRGQRMEYTGPFDVPIIYPLRYTSPELEPEVTDYEMIGGMCVMQLRGNHIEYFFEANRRIRNLDLIQYDNFNQKYKQVLIITSIIPDTIFDQTSCLHGTMLLDTINDCKVETLEQFREALYKSAETGTIALSTKSNVATVVSLDTLLAQEPLLSQHYNFPMSPTIHKLYELRRQFDAGPKD